MLVPLDGDMSGCHALIGYTEDDAREQLEMRRGRPSGDMLPISFDGIASKYFSCAMNAATSLFSSFEWLAGLEAGHLRSMMHPADIDCCGKGGVTGVGASVLRVLRYPPCGGQIEVSCGAHFDHGIITVAPLSDIPGLQVVIYTLWYLRGI